MQHRVSTIFSMVGSLQALAMALLFVVPGAMFEFGIERHVGYWRTGIADRVLRFLTTSAILQLIAAPGTFLLWNRYVRGRSVVQFNSMPWPLWAMSIGMLAMPFALGLFVGAHARHGAPWVRWVLGREPEPKAWDHVFGLTDRAGYVRIRLNSGGWIAGIWGETDGEQGYASSHPNDEDLYLATQVVVDPWTGTIQHDADGQPIVTEWGVLVERSHVEIIEFQPFDTLA